MALKSVRIFQVVILGLALLTGSNAAAISVADGEFILEMNETTEAAQFGSILGSDKQLKQSRIRIVKKNAKRIERDVSAAMLKKQCDDLIAKTGAKSCSPNYKVSVSVTPNDEKFPALYGMRSISAPAAWDIKSGGSTVVAVIDTGVDYTHPDLVNNMWHNPGEIAGNSIDDDSNGYVDDVYGYDFVNEDSDPFDDQSHGTHVSGTIGAEGNNTIGVVGVSWDVEIMALKFLDSSGSGYLSDAIRAVNYATAMGAKITNNSWGGGGYSQALYNAISAANDAGVLFVAAAGNEANDNDSSPSYPASYNLPNVISVAATDRNDNIAYFSNYGANSVDIAAPGVRITSTVPGGGYSSYSGTSMATPHVAGAAALLSSANPELSAHQLKDLLLNNSDAVASLTGLVATAGRLNIAKALLAGLPNNSEEGLDLSISSKISARQIKAGALYGGKVGQLEMTSYADAARDVTFTLELYGTTCASTVTKSIQPGVNNLGGKLPLFIENGEGALRAVYQDQVLGEESFKIVKARGKVAAKSTTSSSQIRRLCSATLAALTK